MGFRLSPEGTSRVNLYLGDTAISGTNPLPISGSFSATVDGAYVDDSPFTVATDKGLAVGGIFTTDSIDAGDFGAFKINTKRELFIVQDVAASLNMTEASALAIKTAVEIMDDWDESDRAKINPIVGQAGVQGGAGAVTANTQRVTLTDENLTALELIGVKGTDGSTISSITNPLPTVERISTTATLTNVSASASSVQLLAANANRVGLIIFNDSTSSLYMKFGTTASTTNFTLKVFQGSSYEMTLPIFTGRIDGVWDVAVGSARITELT